MKTSSKNENAVAKAQKERIKQIMENEVGERHGAIKLFAKKFKLRNDAYGYSFDDVEIVFPCFPLRLLFRRRFRYRRRYRFRYRYRGEIHVIACEFTIVHRIFFISPYLIVENLPD